MQPVGEVEKMLRWISDVDEDEIVRDHAGAVLESLEAWRMKNLLAVRKTGNDDRGLGIDVRPMGHGFGLEGGLRGLDIGPRKDDGGRRVVEEIE